MNSQTTNTSKTEAKLVIIGGGVIGCSLLYHLAAAGWSDLILVEEAQLTSGSTWHAAANGNTFNGSSLIAWSMKRTFDLWAEIEEESGQVVGALSGNTTRSTKLSGSKKCSCKIPLNKLRKSIVGYKSLPSYKFLAPSPGQSHITLPPFTAPPINRAAVAVP